MRRHGRPWRATLSEWYACAPANASATFQVPVEVDESPEPEPARASPKHPADSGQVVQVTVRMVADPDRYTDASANAIRGYERARIIQASRVSLATARELMC